MNKPGKNLEIDSIESLFLAIENETEWLETTDGDKVECISIETLLEILKQFFKNNSQN